MRIIIVGPGASGKDYFRDYLVNKGFKPGISSTTREPRPGEVDGQTYHFLTVTDFQYEITNEKMIEFCEFSGWYYGTGIDDWYSKDVFIMTPSGMSQINSEHLNESVIVYFNAPREIRKQRLIERFKKHPSGDTPERRLDTDDRNFKDFREYDIEVTDPNYIPDKIFESINAFIKLQKNV